MDSNKKLSQIESLCDSKVTTVKRHVAIIIILIIICIGAVVFSERQTERQVLKAETVMLRTATVTQKQVISGNLYPVREVEVKSAIAGVLERYYVRTGDRIRNGDRIAKIRILSEPSQIESARSSLKTAEIVFRRDSMNFERYRRLLDKGVVTESEYEDIEKIFQVSREGYEYAVNRLHLLEEGFIPSSDVSNVVIATADGTVIDLPLEEGTPVVERNNFRDGTTVALVARMDSFVFKGRIVENDVLALGAGMKLSVLPSSVEGFRAEAEIRKISPKGNIDNGVMKYGIEAVFPMPDSVRIYSGFNATAEFVKRERKDVPVIPEECLIFRNDTAYVNVLEAGKIVMRRVELGLSDGIDTEVVGGINEKDVVYRKRQ